MVGVLYPTSLQARYNPPSIPPARCHGSLNTALIVKDADAFLGTGYVIGKICRGSSEILGSADVSNMGIGPIRVSHLGSLGWRDPQDLKYVKRVRILL